MPAAMPRASAADSWFTVLRVGAALGGVTLLGRPRVSPDGPWEFRLEMVDDSAELLDGELVQDSRGLEPLICESSAADWNAALALLDRYPWTLLYPREVHSAFVGRVREAVDARLARESRWELVERANRNWHRVLAAERGE